MVENAQEIRAKEIARRIGIEAMKSETIPIGKQIIASETALDRFLRNGAWRERRWMTRCRGSVGRKALCEPRTYATTSR